MTKQSSMVQDIFINHVIKEKSKIHIHLRNGVNLRGIATNQDDDILILNTNMSHMLVYKHAISTILPHSMLEL
jgi:host factor-I protein